MSLTSSTEIWHNVVAIFVFDVTTSYLHPFVIFTRLSHPDIQTKVQENLNRIELWCKDNDMFINCNKAKCIAVGTKQKLAFQNEELYLTIILNNYNILLVKNYLVSKLTQI